jgi:RNA polymerase sigma-70 factor, ECF subfamily
MSRRDQRSDSELITAAQAGDRAAMDALLRRHQDLIWSVSRRILGNDADAADATQEAMVAIVRGLPRFDARARFTTWAYRIATNAALDEIRRRGRRAIPHEEVREVAVDGDEQWVADRLVLDAALAKLGDDFRTAVVLRDVADLDYAEIAEVLDVPIGTVRSRIARGRAALADTLGNRFTTSRRQSTTEADDIGDTSSGNAAP